MSRRRSISATPRVRTSGVSTRSSRASCIATAVENGDDDSQDPGKNLTPVKRLSAQASSSSSSISRKHISTLPQERNADTHIEPELWSEKEKARTRDESVSNVRSGDLHGFLKHSTKR